MRFLKEREKAPFENSPIVRTASPSLSPVSSLPSSEPEELPQKPVDGDLQAASHSPRSNKGRFLAKDGW